MLNVNPSTLIRRWSIKRSLMLLALVYGSMSIVYFVNGGWHGVDGSNFSEFSLVVLSMPWFLILDKAPAVPAPDASLLIGFIWFVVAPFLANSVCVLVFGMLWRRFTGRKCCV